MHARVGPGVKALQCKLFLVVFSLYHLNVYGHNAPISVK